MIKRPVGVVISATTLGLVVLLGVFALHVVHHIESASWAMTTQLFQLALAAWAISTIVGLFRMRSWARTSMMVIGGCLAGSCLFGAMRVVIVPLLLRTTPGPLVEGPLWFEHQLHTAFSIVATMFLFIAAVFLFVAAIGVWWLVYFSLRRTREAFAQAAASGNVTDQAAA
jgi:hypothetical protein